MRAWIPPAVVSLLALLVGTGGSSQVSPHLQMALEEQQRLVAERPGDPRVFNDLGNLLSLSGDLVGAEEAYRRALELDPDHLTAHFNLGLLLQQQGDLEASADAFRAALEIDAEHAWSHYQLGSVFEILGQRETAVSHYGRAFTLDPDLLFPEINPHIIENGLVTEALLRARRGAVGAFGPPRAYNDAQRITGMLLPSAPEPSSGPEEPGGAAPQVFPPRVSPQEGMPAPATEAQDPTTGETSASPPAEASGGLAVVPQDRVLDSDDLRGGVRNQLDEGRPSLSRGRDRGGRATRRQPTIVQPPARDQGLRPGLGSTGALEWELGGPRTRLSSLTPEAL